MMAILNAMQPGLVVPSPDSTEESQRQADLTQRAARSANTAASARNATAPTTATKA